MKKLVFIAIAFAALAFAGCEQEKFVGASQDGVLTVLSAGREAGPATKSALTEDGDNYWSVGDKILVAWAGQNPETFTSKEKEPSETAKFQGFLPSNNSGDDNKYAIYPAEDGNVVNADGSFDLQYHAEQDGVAGTYDPTAFLAVAQSSDNNLAFYNVLGLLRINFIDADIRKVILRPGATPVEEEEDEVIEEEDPDEDVDDEDVDVDEDDEEPVEEPVDNGFIPGGILTVEGKTPELTAWSEELGEVILKAPKGNNFATGTAYYLAVPPCVLENGVTFEVMHSDGSSSLISINGPVEVERSKIHDVTLESNPYIPVEEIVFDSEEEEVEVESTITLEPTVKPNKATDKTLDWSSEDESIATVEDGVVTGVAEGTVVITATAYDDEGNIEAEGQITIIVTCPWVDLGLSVLWAKCNLDAESPEEAGGYYAWGETETKEEYTWQNYLLADSLEDSKWGDYYTEDTFPWNYGWVFINKYTWPDGQVDGIWYEYWGYFDDEESLLNFYDEYQEDIESGYIVIDDTYLEEYGYWEVYGFIGDEMYYFNEYDYEDDAARVNLGGEWRIPSSDEWIELMNNCDWEWFDDYEDTGVCGYLVTSLVEGFEEASIFIPAAGFMVKSTLYTEYYDGYPAGFYWSDETSWSYSDCAVTPYIDNEEISIWGLGSSYIEVYRCYGLPVRPVMSKPTEGEPARYSLPSARKMRSKADLENLPKPNNLKAGPSRNASHMLKSAPAKKSDLLQPEMRIKR